MIHHETWCKEALGMDQALERGLQEYARLKDNKALNRVVREIGIRSMSARQRIVDFLANLAVKEQMPTKYGDKVMWALSRNLPRYPRVHSTYIVYHPWPEQLPEVVMEFWVTEMDVPVKEHTEKENLRAFLRRDYRNYNGDLLWDFVDGGLYAAETYDDWDFEEEHDESYEEEYIVRAPTPEKKQQIFDWWSRRGELGR